MSRNIGCVPEPCTWALSELGRYGNRGRFGLRAALLAELFNVAHGRVLIPASLKPR